MRSFGYFSKISLISMEQSADVVSKGILDGEIDDRWNEETIRISLTHTTRAASTDRKVAARACTTGE